ncbi:hypothetical protein [Streptomyces sp. SID13031]|uniref:hypothetical protein n=1 Tax=Streptomyces sp. SID13031 TaxID=2706046 RepID=UPI0013CC23E2|nr:hypothetical protein [Streptomyces sp. SID13031]NEA36375.1 hypothetical protein [Streptomyces sp. SID13031]
MDTRGQLFRKALIQAAMAALVTGVIVGILLAVPTPLCPSEAEDCLIDEYGTHTHLSISIAGIALLIALPIAALKARVGSLYVLGGFFAVLLANLAWHLSGDAAWVLGLAVAAVALLAAYVLATRGKTWLVAAAFVAVGIGYPVLLEFKTMVPIVNALRGQGGALVPQLEYARVTDPQVVSDEVSYLVESTDVSLSKRQLAAGTMPCVGSIVSCVEEGPGVWRGTDTSGRTQFWVHGEQDQWAQLTYVGNENEPGPVRDSHYAYAGDLAHSLRPASPWRIAVAGCGVCNHFR